MNPVLPNLLHTGPSSLQQKESAATELSFFAKPTDAGQHSSANAQPFSEVLAHSKREPEHLAQPFDEPMYSDRERSNPDQGLSRSSEYSDRLAETNHDVPNDRLDTNTDSSDAQANTTAAPANASAREETSRESQVQADNGTSRTADSKADADATSNPHATANPEQSEVDHVVRKQVARTPARTIMQRLRARLATLGLAKTLGRPRGATKQVAANRAALGTANALPLAGALRSQQASTSPKAIQSMATDLVQEMTQNVPELNDTQSRRGNEVASSIRGGTVETATETAAKPVAIVEADGTTQNDRSESSRARNMGAQRNDESEQTDAGSQQDLSGEAQGDAENTLQENRRPNTDKPMDGARFQSAMKSHAQSAQARAERVVANMSGSTASMTNESSDGMVELDAEQAKIVSQLSSTRGTSASRLQGAKTTAAQAKQTAQLNQLHQQIANHLDKAHAKMSATRTKLTVHLADLGDVQVQMRMRADGTANGRLQVLMQATEAQTVSLLRQGSSALHAVLESKGYQQPILEVGQASDNAETDLMNRGGDSSTSQQDAQDEATYRDANMAAIGRRQQNRSTPASPGTTATRSGNGLHVVA